MATLIPLSDLSGRDTYRALRASADPVNAPPQEPCRNPDHHGQYTYLLLRLEDPAGRPDPGPSLFTNNRALFFACTDCRDAAYAELFPQCPPEHRPYRYQVNCPQGPAAAGRPERIYAGCWACRCEADVTPALPRDRETVRRGD